MGCEIAREALSTYSSHTDCEEERITRQSEQQMNECYPQHDPSEEDERAAKELDRNLNEYINHFVATLKQQKGSLSSDEEVFARMDAYSKWVEQNIHVLDFSERVQSIIREYERAAGKSRRREYLISGSRRRGR